MTPLPTPDPDAIRHALRRVMDPEVGINIVDLGLIYKIDSKPGELYVEMTMTSPACPLADMILDDIDSVLDPLVPPEVEIRVEIVWDPPWSPDKMAPEARGSALALFALCLFVGQAVGVPLAAPIVDRWGAVPIFWAAALFLPALALFFAVSLRKHRA